MIDKIDKDTSHHSWDFGVEESYKEHGNCPSVCGEVLQTKPNRRTQHDFAMLRYCDDMET